MDEDGRRSACKYRMLDCVIPFPVGALSCSCYAFRFDRIIQKQIPSTIVYEDDMVSANHGTFFLPPKTRRKAPLWRILLGTKLLPVSLSLHGFSPLMPCTVSFCSYCEVMARPFFQPFMRLPAPWLCDDCRRWLSVTSVLRPLCTFWSSQRSGLALHSCLRSFCNPRCCRISSVWHPVLFVLNT